MSESTNRTNPNNDEYWKNQGFESRPQDWQERVREEKKAANDNRSAQLNPNNGEYWKSRGLSGRPDDLNDQVVQDDDWVPDCDECGDASHVDGPYSDGDYYCSYCSHNISIDDEDEDDGWVPDCNSCEDDEDVTGPDEDGDYYCGYSGCEHYIDDDGDCIDDGCDCDEDEDDEDEDDEDEDDYYDEDEIIPDIQLGDRVDRILLPKINTQIWIIADRKKMKSIDGDIEQIDIILRPTAINNNGMLLISAMNLPSELTSFDVDSVERMRKSIGAEFSFILFDPKMSVTQNVFDRIQQYPMRAIHLKEPLHDSLLNLIKSGIGL